MDRVYSHLYKIKKPLLHTAIGLHFNSDGHKQWEDVEISVVEYISAHPLSDQAKKCRNKAENIWIHRLCTTVPYGLNLMDAPIYGSGQ